MKKYFLLICFLCSAQAHNTYYLQQSASNSPDEVFVKEVALLPIHGFSSDGNSITMYQETSQEKHLTLLQAYDVGVRYQQLDILQEAITKLKNKKQEVDLLSTLTVLHENLCCEQTSKRVGYVWGGIASACALLPWIGAERTLRPVALPIHQGYWSRSTEYYIPAWQTQTVGSTERFFASALFLAIGGGVALYNYWCFKKVSQNTLCVIEKVISSDIAHVSNKHKTNNMLGNVRNLLCACDKPGLDLLRNRLDL